MTIVFVARTVAWPGRVRSEDRAAFSRNEGLR